MRAKLGGDQIPVTIANPDPDDRFAMIFVVHHLLPDDPGRRSTLLRQRRPTLSTRRTVRPGVPGPDLARYQRQQIVDAHRVDHDHVRLAAVRHDPIDQRFDGQHILISNKVVRLPPVSMRYAWPSELDLMARLNCLHRRHRWGGWRRESYLGTVRDHRGSDGGPNHT
ncbi:hypothetical protein [Micromonospora sp. WMMD1082]|uniref:hypothetical protein n=1 Tax=Micromonospora sp. WMMD1082 TaxID=3016104 RepID=UPI002416ECD7|nr:hypothetical protein [Micromonospora sp. WMMD1082]MDG4795522.1 hypothetical protein [Micromonospora sp. WMMD1082]